MKFNRKNLLEIFYNFINTRITIFCFGIIIATIFSTNILAVLAVFLVVSFFLQKKNLILLVIIILVGFSYNSLYIRFLNKNLSDLENQHYAGLASVIETFPRFIILKLENKNLVIYETNQFENIFEFGDNLYIEGVLDRTSKSKLNTNTVSFLQEKNIHLTINLSNLEFSDKGTLNFQENLKKFLISKLKKNLPNDNFSIISGITLGHKEELDKTLKESIQNIGISHIFSASGFNLTILYLIYSQVSLIKNKKINHFLEIIFLTTYTFLIGINILPAFRSWLMLLHITAGKLMLKKYNIFISFMVSISLILIFYPLYWKNISLVLSIFSTLGILLFSDYIYKKIKQKNTFVNIFLLIFSTSIATLIATAPITFIEFKEFNFISILSNLIIGPLIPTITVYGFIANLVSLFDINLLNSSIFLPLNYLLFLLKYLISQLDKIPFKSSNSIYSLITFYLVVLSTIYLLNKKKKNEK